MTTSEIVLQNLILPCRRSSIFAVRSVLQHIILGGLPQVEAVNEILSIDINLLLQSLPAGSGNVNKQLCSLKQHKPLTQQHEP